jgi:hypothetical protein
MTFVPINYTGMRRLTNQLIRVAFAIFFILMPLVDETCYPGSFLHCCQFLGRVMHRPRFGYRQQPIHVSQVVARWWRWRRGGGVSQAEPGTSAKGHLADGAFCIYKFQLAPQLDRQ